MHELAFGVVICFAVWSSVLVAKVSRRLARARRARVHLSPQPRPWLGRRVARSRGHRAPPAAAAPASAEPPGGAGSPSSRLLVAAASASAEPSGAPSSRTPVAAGPASAGPAAPAVVPVACLDPHHDFESGRC